VVFRIDPTTLFRLGTVDLPDEVGSIGDAIEAIFQYLEGLRLRPPEVVSRAPSGARVLFDQHWIKVFKV
jgi:hypothetical protein